MVRGLEVSPDFPHGLRVHVIEYQPAAIAVSDSGRVPVAGDGTILRGMKAKGNLPTIAVDGAVGGDSLTDATARDAAAVAGVAPAVLRSRIENVQKRTRRRLRRRAARRSRADLRLRQAAASQVGRGCARARGPRGARGDLRRPAHPRPPGGRRARGEHRRRPWRPPEASGLDTTGVTDPSTSLPAQTTPPPEATTPPTTATTPPAAEATQPTVPQAPAQPTEPLTAGTGGGATAAP